MFEGLLAVGGLDVVCCCGWLKAEDFVRVDVGGWQIADIFRVGCHRSQVSWVRSGGNLMWRLKEAAEEKWYIERRAGTRSRETRD